MDPQCVTVIRGPDDSGCILCVIPNSSTVKCEMGRAGYSNSLISEVSSVLPVLPASPCPHVKQTYLINISSCLLRTPVKKYHLKPDSDPAPSKKITVLLS